MAENEAGRQADNIRPPRKTEVLALGVDVTARCYDLEGLTMGGKTYNVAAGVRDAIYFTLEAELADVYYYFGSASVTITMSAASVISPGSALAYDAKYCMRVPQNDTRDVRIERSVDKFLYVVVSAGSAILRMYASSQPTIA